MAKNIDDLYPKRFLQTDQLDGDWELTIKEAWVEELNDFDGKPQNKLVLSFEEIESEFPLTPTNAGRIKALLGADYEQYKGKQVLIGLEDEPKSPKKVAIRIKKPMRVTKPVPKQAPVATAHPASMPKHGKPALVPSSEAEAAAAGADEADVPQPGKDW